MSFSSALYAGHVIHSRLRPKTHRLRYRVFSILLDLDELSTLDNGLRLFGHNRRALFSFHESDHGAGSRDGLKAWVLGLLAEAGLATEGMRVALLCYPRILGHGFNPLSVYFCRTAEGELRAVLYEVHNTFKERHTYVIPARLDANGRLRHECAKRMYVSPFIPMDCRYRFNIVPPSDKVVVAIDESDAQGRLLHAAFAARRRPLTDRTLLAALATYPLMTLKVVGAIHWEALRLWLKGIAVHRHHAAASPIARTIVTDSHSKEI